MVEYKTKKQELIERITKMLEPYDNIDDYSFQINLYYKTGEYTRDFIQVAYNNYPYATANQFIC